MQDISIAELRLKKKENLSLVIVKSGRIIFETESHGIMTVLRAIDKSGRELGGSAVADRIIGHAVALLCAYSKIGSVFAMIISEGGIRVLEENGIHYHFEKKFQVFLTWKKMTSVHSRDLQRTPKPPKKPTQQ